MGILIYIPFSTNTGYAIKSLEMAFYCMAKSIYQNDDKIHFLYKDIMGGFPESLPTNFSNIISLESNLQVICQYIKKNSIATLFGLDLPVNHLFYKPFRKAGIRQVVAYWGAPMSDTSGKFKLMVKRVLVALNRYQPNHYIFESKMMADMAVSGRGIKSSKTSVVYLGVDTQKFQPQNFSSYAKRSFNIPPERYIVFYSGHMEERKGVNVIISAAVYLVEKLGRKDVHFLLCGNKQNQESRFFSLYKNTDAQDYITFAGYRDDLHKVMPCCHIGVIASTGWDSFTVSSLEMAACGLPLIVSNLQGLPETIQNGKTGLLFTPGNHIDLAQKIIHLVDNQQLYKDMSEAARHRILQHFTLNHQHSNLVSVVKKVLHS